MKRLKENLRMRPQTKWITVLILALAVVATGCGKKRKDSGAEALDATPDADTAMVDNSLTAELPPIDDAKPFDDSAKAPAPAVNSSGDMETYTVQGGDTLMKIAFNLYGDIAQWKNIYAWNKDTLKRASALEKGMSLKYEKPSIDPIVERNGEPYLIKKGDTLASIADDVYAKRSKWKRLWANNRTLIHNPHRIYAGFYVYYQITEQEKKLAESIKAKRGAGADPAAMSAVPPSDPVPSAAVAPAAPVAPDPASTGAKAGASGAKAGGLSALSGAGNQRTPASATQPAAPGASK